MSAQTATASVSVTEMGTVLTLKQLAELYLQDFISNDEYTEAETQAPKLEDFDYSSVNISDYVSVPKKEYENSKITLGTEYTFIIM